MIDNVEEPPARRAESGPIIWAGARCTGGTERGKGSGAGRLAEGLLRRWLLLRGQLPCESEKIGTRRAEWTDRLEVWARKRRRKVLGVSRSIGEEGDFGYRRPYQQVIANNCTVLGPRCAKKDYTIRWSSLSVGIYVLGVSVMFYS